MSAAEVCGLLALLVLADILGDVLAGLTGEGFVAWLDPRLRCMLLGALCRPKSPSKD